MRDERLRPLAAAGLVIGALLGMAGTFATSAEVRGLLWLVDGVALVAGSALLTVLHLRRGNELLSRPLPFFAYPVFALTLFGWAWVHWRPASPDAAGST